MHLVQGLDVRACDQCEYRPSTALLELSALWYPPRREEESAGRACQSGGGPGAAEVIGQLRGALATTEGPGCPGALDDRVAHGVAPQAL
jgi:hypothetical protein